MVGGYMGGLHAGEWSPEHSTPPKFDLQMVVFENQLKVAKNIVDEMDISAGVL